MECKKILATVLAFLTFLPSMKASANSSINRVETQTAKSNYSGAFWAITIVTGAALCAASGYGGYRLGKSQYFSKNKKSKMLDPDKEINLVGPKYEDPTVAPDGVHRFDLLTIDYIDKLLNIDIPKLITSDEFPAQYLANVRGICFLVPHTLENIATKNNCHKTRGLSLKLKNKRLILQQIVENDEKITVGYLVNLLNEIKELLQEAAPIIEQNYYS